MTFYSEQVHKINRELYPKPYLTRQLIGAKQYIDRHFAEIQNLDEVATKAFISKFHFIRLFKLLYGRTPHQYLTAVRVENAKRLLMNGQTVLAACADVGFKSSTSFTGLFKKATGHTPTTFMMSHKKSNFQEAGL